MATIGNINVGITATTRGLDKGIDEAKRKVGALSGRGGVGGGGGKGGGGKGAGGGLPLAFGGGKLLGAAAALLSVRALGKVADEWTIIGNKIGTVTDGVEDQKATMEKVLDTANRVRSPIGAVAAVFQRFAFAGKNFGTTNEEALKMVETLFKIGVVGGVTGVEMRATLIQLSQGFGKGRLDGIELTSVMEQMAPLAQLFADKLGVPIGKLKDLGAAGRLTSQVIKETLVDNAALIDAKFDATKVTVAQTLDIMANKWTVLVGTINEATQATEKFKSSAAAVSDTMNFLSNAISDEKSIERRFFQDIGDALKNSPFGIIGETIGGVQAAMISMGSDQFFGPENPLTGLDLEEANSGKILAELKVISANAMGNLSNFTQTGKFG